MNEWSPRGTTRTPVPWARAGESLLTHPQTEAEAKRALAVLGPRMSVNDQLPKPFDLTDLYKTVERWMPAA